MLRQSSLAQPERFSFGVSTEESSGEIEKCTALETLIVQSGIQFLPRMCILGNQQTASPSTYKWLGKVTCMNLLRALDILSEKIESIRVPVLEKIGGYLFIPVARFNRTSGLVQVAATNRLSQKTKDAFLTLHTLYTGLEYKFDSNFIVNDSAMSVQS